MIPALDATTSFLPLGRYACTLDELKQRYVDDPSYASSASRAEIFNHFVKACDMLNRISPDLIEVVWVGGSFVTGAIDPDDIDCTFLISGPAFRALESNGLRDKVTKFGKKGWLRQRSQLRVEPFIVIREPIANPFSKNGVSEDARNYTSLRGAWDDWWMRVRSNPDKSALPVVEDAEPKRGYLEVKLK
jgi:hypothetical protein